MKLYMRKINTVNLIQHVSKVRYGRSLGSKIVSSSGFQTLNKVAKCFLAN